MRAKMISAAALLLCAACAGTPKTHQEESNLDTRARTTLDRMTSRDPGLHRVLGQAYGYVVFPEVGKGGFIAGGAHGIGVVFERGRRVGYAELNQASLGAQLGGQTFAELVILQTPQALERIKRDKFAFGADASAVAITAGAAAAVRFQNGAAVFVMTHGGLMAGVSVDGQSIRFEPRG
jgi:lipid-binding SYLF domain-containing protein